MIPFIFVAPVQLAVFIYLLWQDLSWTCFVGLGFVLMLIPLQVVIGKLSAKYRFAVAEATDERGRLMSEIIIAMRVIKMYAWEKPFCTIIATIRKLEVKHLKHRSHVRALQSSMFQVAAKLVPYLTLITFIYASNEEFTADKVFFSVAVFNTVIQTMVHFVPQGLSSIAELSVSLDRIETFLLLDELNQDSIHGNETSSMRLTTQIVKKRASDEQKKEPVSISFENASASWTPEKVTLSNINLKLEGPKLILCVGKVGSGKTSFLHTLIAELPVSSGSVSVDGITSYAAQEAWIFAQDVRHNILFGLDYDEKRYNEVVEACALLDDFKQFPFGDLTIVGERGVALSGGQKARVNLARSLYRKADIYLCDDALSAVDSKVSKHLFEKCMKGYLSNHMRILVTHQVHYLPQSDYIIVFNNGEVMFHGTYEELIEQGLDVAGLVSEDAVDELTRKGSVVKNEVTEQQEVKKSEGPEANNEKVQAGSVTFSTYKSYFLAGKSRCTLLYIFLFGFIGNQILLSGVDFWLSFWTNAEDERTKNVTGCADIENNESCGDYLGRNTYVYVYTAIVFVYLFSSNLRSLTYYYYCTKISNNLHNSMFNALVKAPTKFFDDNPSGRIMNRFTKDVGAVDELLPQAMFETLFIFLQMVGVVGVVIISNYYLSIPAVFLFIALGLIRQFFVQTARDLKRIEALTRSPLFTLVAATMQGLTTIRASQCQSILSVQFDKQSDVHSSVWYLFIASNRWFGITLELVSVAFLTVVTFSFFLMTDVKGGNIGLAISSILTLMGSFQWGMRQSAETENFMTSVERALEYTRIEPEAALESKPDKKPPTNWPSGGEILFQSVSLAYDDKKVLKNLSFEIKSQEKIGIVGRTGAGKSSIITALFRMTEPEGNIFIDGIKINDLRKNISIIPQDPVLFSGTVRYNLDPFNQYPDDNLWQALEEVELKEAVPSLDFIVSDSGSNFSVGQRQLVCLARAILRKNKIIVMDEATANVDPRTDNFIQKTIRQKFADCTIITIAHRLHSVIDCDKILVLDNGYLKEYDHPHILLQETGGILSSMVSHTGKATSQTLHKIAADTYAKKFDNNVENERN